MGEVTHTTPTFRARVALLGSYVDGMHAAMEMVRELLENTAPATEPAKVGAPASTPALRETTPAAPKRKAAADSGAPSGSRFVAAKRKEATVRQTTKLTPAAERRTKNLRLVIEAVRKAWDGFAPRTIAEMVPDVDARYLLLVLREKGALRSEGTTADRRYYRTEEFDTITEQMLRPTAFKYGQAKAALGISTPSTLPVEEEEEA